MFLLIAVPSAVGFLSETYDLLIEKLRRTGGLLVRGLGGRAVGGVGLA
jgi:hypothetical protein